MEKIKLKIDNCKGCFLCVSVCPVKAIEPSNELGAQGYVVVKVDQDKCIQCGSCYRMCPDCVIDVL